MILALNLGDRVLVDVRLHLDRLERIGRRGHEGEDQEAGDEQNRNAVQQPANDVRQHQSGAMIVS